MLKLPHYMKKAGLKNIDCRMNDKVLFPEPDKEDYQQNGIVKYMKQHKEDIALTQVGGLMISYGWK